jgi:hypothetical protein
MDGHRIHVVVHRGEALRRRVARSVHLVGQLLYQHFQLVIFTLSGCKGARQW